MIVKVKNNVAGPEWDNGCQANQLAHVADSIGREMIEAGTATEATDAEVKSGRIVGRHKSANESRV